MRPHNAPESWSVYVSTTPETRCAIADEIEEDSTADGPATTMIVLLAELSASGTSARDYRHVRAFPFPRFALTSFVMSPLRDRRGRCESVICAAGGSSRVAQFLVTIRNGTSGTLCKRLRNVLLHGLISCWQRKQKYKKFEIIIIKRFNINFHIQLNLLKDAI